ncbi:MAG: polysaccharide biosynthesis protein [Frankiales bacterium]|nr:polysaccharide biosynthesis protein [Frankiales bacterium]
MEADPRVLAFYLPQFHPIPENDEWWGPGFTEWTKVVRGQPQFRGHYQPHLPADLGFYDLRVPEVREKQARLAHENGVDGFVYYHYWFQGRRLLERPFAEVLGSGSPDLPFALCWANENWTRIWDGGASEVLMAQSHSDADDAEHFRSLAGAFADPRYIRVDGRPLFLVYRASQLPDARRTTDTWRDEADRLGVPRPFVVRVESFPDERTPPASLGFDAAVDWTPNWGEFAWPLGRDLRSRVRRKLRLSSRAFAEHAVYDYSSLIEWHLTNDRSVDYERYPCVSPSFDNSARRQQRATILRNANPEDYERWLRAALQRADRDLPEGHRLVFVNAWNEWAEGNHLEPDARWGTAYLEATRQARTG